MVDFFFIGGVCVLFLSTYLSVSLWKRRISGNQKPTFHMHIHTPMLYSQIAVSDTSQFCCCWMEHRPWEVGALVLSPPLTPEWELKAETHRPTAGALHMTRMQGKTLRNTERKTLQVTLCTCDRGHLGLSRGTNLFLHHLLLYSYFRMPDRYSGHISTSS